MKKSRKKLDFRKSQKQLTLYKLPRSWILQKTSKKPVKNLEKSWKTSFFDFFDKSDFPPDLGQNIRSCQSPGSGSFFDRKTRKKREKQQKNAVFDPKNTGPCKRYSGCQLAGGAIFVKNSKKRPLFVKFWKQLTLYKLPRTWILRENRVFLKKQSKFGLRDLVQTTQVVNRPGPLLRRKNPFFEPGTLVKTYAYVNFAERRKNVKKTTPKKQLTLYKLPRTWIGRWRSVFKNSRFSQKNYLGHLERRREFCANWGSKKVEKSWPWPKHTDT